MRVVNRNTIFNFQFSIFNWRAQSLIEVVVAMAVITGLAIALVTMSLFSQKTAREARNNTQASKLAQENVEQVRIYRDRYGYKNLLDTTGGSGHEDCYKFKTTNPVPLITDLTPLSGCTKENGETIPLGSTNFLRIIDIKNSTSGTTTTVAVMVFWTDSSGTQSVTNTTILSAGP